jgi:hypothetical protein
MITGGDDEDSVPMSMVKRESNTSLVSTRSNSTNNGESSTTASIGKPIEKKRKKKLTSNHSVSPFSVMYKGANIYQAAQEGNLPLCVLLWGMASAKRVNLLEADAQGNCVLHAAALSDNSEVMYLREFISFRYRNSDMRIKLHRSSRSFCNKHRSPTTYN